MVAQHSSRVLNGVNKSMFVFTCGESEIHNDESSLYVVCDRDKVESTDE